MMKKMRDKLIFANSISAIKSSQRITHKIEFNIESRFDRRSPISTLRTSGLNVTSL